LKKLRERVRKKVKKKNKQEDNHNKQKIANSEMEPLLEATNKTQDEYIQFLFTCYDKIKENSIHPKIFGFDLSGTLLKTLVGVAFTILVAFVRVALQYGFKN